MLARVAFYGCVKNRRHRQGLVRSSGWSLAHILQLRALDSTRDAVGIAAEIAGGFAAVVMPRAVRVILADPAVAAMAAQHVQPFFRHSPPDPNSGP